MHGCVLQPFERQLSLLGGFLQVGDQVVSVLGLLQPTESHLGTRNVLLGILKVVRHGLLGPDYTLLLVGVSIREALSLTGLSAKDTVQIRTDLVGTTGLNSVALQASRLEQSSTFLLGSFFKWGRHFCEYTCERFGENSGAPLGARCALNTLFFRARVTGT